MDQDLHRAVECSMFVTTLKVHKLYCNKNEKGLAEVVAELKWICTGFVAIYKREEGTLIWNSIISCWKTLREHYLIEWADDIKGVGSLVWIQQTQKRDKWCRMRELKNRLKVANNDGIKIFSE